MNSTDLRPVGSAHSIASRGFQRSKKVDFCLFQGHSFPDL
jgi:hypothetical protein